MHDFVFNSDFTCDSGSLSDGHDLAFDGFIHVFRVILIDFDPAEDGTHKWTLWTTGQ
jgi:hypothetical protein